MYFITCFEQIDKDELDSPDIGCYRVFGYYDNFQDADKSLRINLCDMFESIYHYAVIEHIGQGIHPFAQERWFYKYDRESNGYLPIVEPEAMKQYTNLALG